MSTTLTASLSPNRLSVGAGWRTEAAVVVGLLACWYLIEQFRIYDTFAFATLGDYLLELADTIGRTLLGSPVIVAALHVASRVGGAGWRRAVSACALMVGAALLSAVVFVYGLPYEPVYITVGAAASSTIALWYETWTRTLICLLALLIVGQLRARQQAMTRLAERHQRSMAVRRQLALAQLQAIQARVDPQLLFDMLAAVKRLYERDAARAETLLDELTAFLRAALPRLRSERSTLEVEFGLVGCYVRLLRAAGDATIELKAALPEELAGAAFPAGLLLPLVARQPAVSRCVGLEAQAIDAGTLRVRIVDLAAPGPEAIARLETSLADLYGERARLRTPSPTEIEWELPREHE